jgi:hypothetical protein
LQDGAQEPDPGYDVATGASVETYTEAGVVRVAKVVGTEYVSVGALDEVLIYRLVDTFTGMLVETLMYTLVEASVGKLVGMSVRELLGSPVVDTSVSVAVATVVFWPRVVATRERETRRILETGTILIALVGVFFYEVEILTSCDTR